MNLQLVDQLFCAHVEALKLHGAWHIFITYAGQSAPFISSEPRVITYKQCRLCLDDIDCIYAVQPCKKGARGNNSVGRPLAVLCDSAVSPVNSTCTKKNALVVSRSLLVPCALLLGLPRVKVMGDYLVAGSITIRNPGLLGG